MNFISHVGSFHDRDINAPLRLIIRNQTVQWRKEIHFCTFRINKVSKHFKEKSLDIK